MPRPEASFSTARTRLACPDFALIVSTRVSAAFTAALSPESCAFHKASSASSSCAVSPASISASSRSIATPAATPFTPSSGLEISVARLISASSAGSAIGSVATMLRFTCSRGERPPLFRNWGSIPPTAAPIRPAWKDSERTSPIRKSSPSTTEEIAASRNWSKPSSTNSSPASAKICLPIFPSSLRSVLSAKALRPPLERKSFTVIALLGLPSLPRAARCEPPPRVFANSTVFAPLANAATCVSREVKTPPISSRFNADPFSRSAMESESEFFDS